MSRTLVITTLAGLLVSAAALGAAVTIGGDDIFHDPHSLSAVKPLIDLATHKEWRWNGGDTLAMDAPINIRYRPEGPRQVSVTGPAEVIQHVRVADGRIATDNNVSRRTGRKVQALVSGVPIRKFVVNGGEELDLGEIHQPDLDLHINGGGDVVGRGEVGRLNLTISGAGDAKLGGLSVTEDAKVALLGNGDATLAPKGHLRVFIAGNATLNLTSKPKSMSRTVLGGGEIHEIDVARVAAEASRAALSGMDVGGIASESARDAIQSTLGNGEIGRIASEAARKGIAEAQIDRQVREGLKRGLAGMNSGNGDFSIIDHRSIDFGHIEQPRAKISVMASGSATAEGQVDQMEVAVMGSGNANLGALRARRAEVVIGGSGTATVSVSDRLKVTILGSGNVRLMTRPARIEQTILGPGRIIPAP
jgi:hypothetical protein